MSPWLFTKHSVFGYSSLLHCNSNMLTPMCSIYTLLPYHAMKSTDIPSSEWYKPVQTYLLCTQYCQSICTGSTPVWSHPPEDLLLFLHLLSRSDPYTPCSDEIKKRPGGRGYGWRRICWFRFSIILYNVQLDVRKVYCASYTRSNTF